MSSPISESEAASVATVVNAPAAEHAGANIDLASGPVDAPVTSQVDDPGAASLDAPVTPQADTLAGANIDPAPGPVPTPAPATVVPRTTTSASVAGPAFASTSAARAMEASVTAAFQGLAGGKKSQTPHYPYTSGPLPPNFVQLPGMAPFKDMRSIEHELGKNRRVEHKADPVPNRFELFLLEPNQKKVEEKTETRSPNTSTFILRKEDHTLGNLIQQRLLKLECVTFAAYKVPHPLFAEIEIRISTDGSITPKQALTQVCLESISELETLKQSFTTEFLAKKIVSEGEAQRRDREQNNF